MSCEQGRAHKVELKAQVGASSRKRVVAAQVVSCAASSNLGPALTNQQYFLAIQTPAGWFVRYLGEDGTVCGFDAPVSVRYHPRSLRVRGHQVHLHLAGQEASDPPALCCTVGEDGTPGCGDQGMCR
ncbi:MAG: hypothetical protein HY898_15850 [Deltaproteobacteria bacterium]|nr:hypothetical protein [Deltaproteobacteria bacterium]